jgi:3-oxoacyl-[acyl-carrier-protein] synthase II
MSQRVVVTGVGVVGSGLSGGWERLAAYLDGPRAMVGTSLDDAPRIDTRALDALLDEGEMRRLSRVCQLTVAATRLALADAELPPGESLGLVVGTEFGDLRSTVEFADGYLDRGPAGLSALLFPNTVMNTMAAATAIAVGAREATLTLNAPGVAGELAVARAVASIAAGRAQHVIAGGVDELDTLRSRMLRELGTIDDARSEGATLLVLESEPAARARGARILAEIRGVARGALPARAHAIGRTTASGVIATASRSASVTPREIAWIYTSVSQDEARERWERAVLADSFEGRTPPIAALARLVGHCAGSGALRVAAAAWTTQSRRLPACDDDTESAATVVAAGPGLVHGLARGGTQVALVVGPAGR